MKPSEVLVVTVLLSLTAASESLLSDLKSITPSDLENLTSGNANEDVDFLLRTFRESLPSPFPIKWNNGTTDCTMSGFKDGIRRKGDADLTVKSGNAVFTFEITFANIESKCDWKIDMVFFDVDGTVRTKTDSAVAKLRIVLYLKPGAHPLLNEFKVTDYGTITPDVSGLGVLNVFAQRIAEWYMDSSGRIAITFLRTSLAEKLQEVLDEMVIPFE